MVAFQAVLLHDVHVDLVLRCAAQSVPTRVTEHRACVLSYASQHATYNAHSTLPQFPSRHYYLYSTIARRLSSHTVEIAAAPCSHCGPLGRLSFTAPTKFLVLSDHEYLRDVAAQVSTCVPVTALGHPALMRRLCPLIATAMYRLRRSCLFVCLRRSAPTAWCGSKASWNTLRTQTRPMNALPHRTAARLQVPHWSSCTDLSQWTLASVPTCTEEYCVLWCPRSDIRSRSL